MTQAKNVFFLAMLTAVGTGSMVVNPASAQPQASNMSVNYRVPAATVTALQAPKMIPDAVITPERLIRSANMSYKVKGVRYIPRTSVAEFSQTGTASWYGKGFHGRKTSSGERFDMNEMTAAHPTLPIPSYARVTNLDNGKSVVVRINDRGPFHSKRVIDLSYAAANKLGYASRGVAHVKVEQMLPGRDKAKPGGLTYVTLKSFSHMDQAQSFMDRRQKEDKNAVLSISRQGNSYEVRQNIAQNPAPAATTPKTTQL